MRNRTCHHKQVHWHGLTKTRDMSHPSMEQPRLRQPIRVFIVDRHEVIRVGVRAILEGEGDFKVVGEVDNVDVLLSEVRRTRPNVVLLESGLSRGLNVASFRKLRTALPSVRVILLMGESETAIRPQGVEDHIQGYVSKTTCQTELSRAIRVVAMGEPYLGPEGSTPPFSPTSQRPGAIFVQSELDALSPQEYRIIALIAEGKTNKEIAVKLALSAKTVKNYIANMFSKLAIERRTQAVALYLRTQHQYKPTGECIPA